MSRTYVPVELRRAVLERAGGHCEYCLYPQAFAFLTFEVEHIVAEKHGGAPLADNLALACSYCNRFKGSDPGSFDPETGQLVPFYHPRRQQWADHFRIEGARIVPLPPRRTCDRRHPTTQQPRPNPGAPTVARRWRVSVNARTIHAPLPHVVRRSTPPTRAAPPIYGRGEKPAHARSPPHASSCALRHPVTTTGSHSPTAPPMRAGTILVTQADRSHPFSRLLFPPDTPLNICHLS